MAVVSSLESPSMTTISSTSLDRSTSARRSTRTTRPMVAASLRAGMQTDTEVPKRSLAWRSALMGSNWL